MIYTTYLSKLKDIPNDANKLFIALKSPGATLDKYNCKHCLLLAPSQELRDRYKEDKDWESFYADFKEEKTNFDDDEIEEFKEILRLCREDKDTYIICYEKDYTHCHRSIVAEGLSAKTGIDWEEASL